MLLLGTTPDELISADLIRCVKPFPEQASAVLTSIFGGWVFSGGPRPSV